MRRRLVAVLPLALLAAAALALGGSARPTTAQLDIKAARADVADAMDAEEAAVKDLHENNSTGAFAALRQSQSFLNKAYRAVGVGTGGHSDIESALRDDGLAKGEMEDDDLSRAASEFEKAIVKKHDFLDVTASLVGGTNKVLVNVTLSLVSSDFGANSAWWVGSGLYFTGYNANEIGNLEGTKLRGFPVPTTNAGLRDLVKGPDGAVWFTEQGAGKIGRLATDGTVTEFPLSNPNAGPYGITSGPDGALWFTEGNAGMIGRITTSGAITEFPIPMPPGGPAPYPVGIATGPDGALWFAEEVGNAIGRITTTGTVTQFPVPSTMSYPAGIAAGPGGLWFTEYNTGKIGRITTAGAVTEYATSGTGTGPDWIVKGPDGNMWATEYNANSVAKVSAAGKVTQVALPSNGNQPTGIAADATSVYVVEYGGNRVIRISAK